LVLKYANWSCDPVPTKPLNFDRKTEEVIHTH
jgi:hypothetical protein